MTHTNEWEARLKNKDYTWLLNDILSMPDTFYRAEQLKKLLELQKQQLLGEIREKIETVFQKHWEEKLSDSYQFNLGAKTETKAILTDLLDSLNEEKGECECYCHKEGKGNYHNVGNTQVNCLCQKEEVGR